MLRFALMSKGFSSHFVSRSRFGKFKLSDGVILVFLATKWMRRKVSLRGKGHFKRRLLGWRGN